jgi:hypothetical protein
MAEYKEPDWPSKKNTPYQYITDNRASEYFHINGCSKGNCTTFVLLFKVDKSLFIKRILILCSAQGLD